MSSFIRHYDPRMPLFLVAKLDKYKYDSEKFINWYLKFSDISKSYQGFKSLKRKKPIFYLISAYYVWVFYILSCTIVATFSWLGAVIGIILSPFIVAGYIYAIAYVWGWLKSKLKKQK